MSALFVESRLHPPTLPPLRFRRSAPCDWVLSRLDQAGQVIAVFAPAGYAKTSLLRAVHAELAVRSHTVAWLSLAPDAGAPDTLVAYLGAALEKAGIEVATASGGDPLHAVIHALGAAAQPLTLIIDNLQDLGPEGVGVLDRLLHDLPATARLVLAGRRDPGLRLAALLARRRLSLLDPSDLAFSFAETMEFMIRETRESLGAAALNELYATTQGWPGLLSVLVSSLRRDETLEALLREDRLPRRELYAYIDEEIIAGLPAEDRPAIEVLALVPEADQALLRFVLGSSGVDLGRLSRRNPLVRVQAGGAFAIHPELRRCLRSRLEAEASQRYAALSRRLGAWYRQQGNAALAIDLYLDGGDLDAASSLLESEGRNIVLEGFPDRCLAWLARLPAEQRERKPGLDLAELWACVTMHALSDCSPRPGPQWSPAQQQDAAFQLEMTTAESFSYVITEQPEAALAAVEALTKAQADGVLAGPSRTALVGAGGASVHAWCRFTQGRFDEAREALFRGGALEMQGQGLLTHVYASIVLGECYLAEGQVATAEGIFRRALKLAENLRGRRSMVAAVVMGPLLDVLYETDQIDELLALASGRNELRLKYSTAGSTMSAGMAMAHALTLRDARAEAHELLDDMLGIGEERRLPRFVAQALAVRLQLALREGRTHELSELAGRIASLRDDTRGLLDSPQGVINFYCRISALRMAAHQGRYDAALAEARALAEALAPRPWARLTTQVDALLAALLWQTGKQAQAVRRLADVIARANAQGLIRSIVDQITCADLIESSELRRAVAAPLHGYLDRLRAAMTRTAPAPSAGHRMIAPGSGWTDATLTGQDPGFTTREREILYLIARGLSAKRIAQALRISPVTAKWHTRNVYEKLGVHDRPSAQLAIQRLRIGDGQDSSR